MNTQAFDFANANRLVTDLILGIFRPLSRILLQYHVPYRRVADLLKWAYVHEAAEEMANGGSLNVSRLAIQTSLCRKEVSRLLKVPEPPIDPHPRRHERLASIVNGWQNDPRFCDKPGSPKALPIAHGENSFRELVETYSADVGYHVLMHEMIELSIASEDNCQLQLLPDLSDAGFVFAHSALYGCVMHVQGRWTALVDQNGRVPPLCIKGPSPSLESMLQDYPDYFDLQVVLEEMKTTGLAAETAEGGSLLFASRRFVPSDPTGLLQAAAAGARHLMLTMDNNLASEKPDRWLQREVMFNGLSEECRRQLLKDLDIGWETLQLKLREKYERLEWQTEGRPIKIGSGIYAFEEEIDPVVLAAPEPRKKQQLFRGG